MKKLLLLSFVLVSAQSFACSWQEASEIAVEQTIEKYEIGGFYIDKMELINGNMYEITVKGDLHGTQIEEFYEIDPDTCEVY